MFTFHSCQSYTLNLFSADWFDLQRFVCIFVRKSWGDGMARPKLGASDSKRLQMVITEDELKAIEDWQFENRVPSKSEAIRRLCQIGVLTAKAAPAMQEHTTLSMAEMVLFLGEVAKICSKHADDPGSLKIRLAVEQYGKSALLHSTQAMTEVGELTNHVSQLVQRREMEESLAVVAKNIIRKGEVDALAVEFVKGALEEFK
jgi:hypothetical protein